MRKLVSTVSAFALLASTAAQAFVVGNSEYDDPTPQGASVATKALMQAACANLAAAHHAPRRRHTILPLAGWAFSGC